MAHIFLPQNNNISQLLLAFGITVGFMIIEAIGGFISGSLALLADAGHMLTDTVALLIALLAVQFAKASREYSAYLRVAALNHPCSLRQFHRASCNYDTVQRRLIIRNQWGHYHDSDCHLRAIGEFGGPLDFASWGRRENTRRCTACDGGFTRLSGRYCRRDYHYLDWLAPY